MPPAGGASGPRSAQIGWQARAGSRPRVRLVVCAGDDRSADRRDRPRAKQTVRKARWAQPPTAASQFHSMPQASAPSHLPGVRPRVREPPTECASERVCRRSRPRRLQRSPERRGGPRGADACVHGECEALTVRGEVGRHDVALAGDRDVRSDAVPPARRLLPAALRRRRVHCSRSAVADAARACDPRLTAIAFLACLCLSQQLC
jgi:hypothetical protein